MAQESEEAIVYDRTFNSSDDDDDLSDADERDRGIASWRPGFRQALRKPQFVLFLLFFGFLVQNMLTNGMQPVVVSTLEQRFGLTSVQLGFILTINDMAAFVFLLLTSYFGRKNRPRNIALGFAAISIGSFLFGTTEFVGKRKERSLDPQDDLELCVRNRTDGTKDVSCKESGGEVSEVMIMFTVGQLLMGVGSTPISTLAVSYLVDAAPSVHSIAWYLGIYYMAAFVGPGVGFFLGSRFLSIPTDLNYSANLTPDDPLWVGAWWLCFLLTAGLMLLLVFPAAALPTDPKRRSTSRLEPRKIEDSVLTSFSLRALYGMGVSIVSLLKNKTIVALLFAGAMEMGTITTAATYTALIIEKQFNVTASMAAIITGSVAVPASMVGSIVPGLVVQNLKMTWRGMVKMCLTASFLSALVIMGFLFHCPGPTFASLEEIQSPDFWSSDVQIHCSKYTNCSCTTKVFQPVCGSDGLTYLSPCLAGCQEMGVANGTTYSNCSCIGSGGTAAPGSCTPPCIWLPVIIEMVFLMIVGGTFTKSTVTAALLGLVEEEQNSLMKGVEETLHHLLGYMPLIPIAGAVIDATCRVWNDECGTGGSCLIYWRNSLGIGFALTLVGSKLLAVLSFTAALATYQEHGGTNSCEQDNESNSGGANERISIG